MKNEARKSYEEIIEGLDTKSAQIRALANAGYLRTEISELLGIRYQHVRKVLVDAGIMDGLQRGLDTPEEAPLPLPQLDEDRNVSWEILLKAGFQYAAEWVLTNDGILQIDGNMPMEPGVYAFVLDEDVVYVGLTHSGLSVRMGQYRYGYKGQKTNARVKQLILEALAQNHSVKILCATPGALEWHGLPINGAAGLEAGLIEMMRPLWNILGTS